MTNSLTYQRFVIIGTARTGSTLLWSYLNSHPDILCLRGVFGSTNKINFGKYYIDLPEECDSKDLINLRNENATKFLEKYIFKNYEKSYLAVGFKYFYDHSRHLIDKNEVLDYFIRHKDIRFIHLKRKNLLYALFSYKRSLSLNLWQQDAPGFKTNISINECEYYFQNILNHQKYFDKIFIKRIMPLNYEDFILYPTKSLHSLQEFLNLEHQNLFTETVKNTEIDLTSSILNFDELNSYFKDSQFREYFDIKA